MCLIALVAGSGDLVTTMLRADQITARQRDANHRKAERRNQKPPEIHN
jgi:hypothetical protein